jgi:hypothetical protein
MVSPRSRLSPPRTPTQPRERCHESHKTTETSRHESPPASPPTTNVAERRAKSHTPNHATKPVSTTGSYRRPLCALLLATSHRRTEAQARARTIGRQLARLAPNERFSWTFFGYRFLHTRNAAPRRLGLGEAVLFAPGGLVPGGTRVGVSTTVFCSRSNPPPRSAVCGLKILGASLRICSDWGKRKTIPN